MDAPDRRNGFQFAAAVQAILLVGFIFTVAAAYVTNQDAISSLVEREKDLDHELDDLRRSIGELETAMARTEEHLRTK